MKDPKVRFTTHQRPYKITFGMLMQQQECTEEEIEKCIKFLLFLKYSDFIETMIFFKKL